MELPHQNQLWKEKINKRQYIKIKGLTFMRCLNTNSHDRIEKYTASIRLDASHVALPLL